MDMTTATNQKIELIEVGLRDGLQNEAKFVPTDVKIELVNKLVEAGLKRIQVSSFVHPKLVPQMSDAEEVCANLPQAEGVVYSGLVLNMKGLERAHAAGLTAVDMSISASDQHSRKNTNRSLEEAESEFEIMVAKAREFGMRVRGGIQCAFGCGQEGPVEMEVVVEIAKSHLALGIDELALADSAGVANPAQITKMVETIQLLTREVPLILHLHDTRGLGLANLLAALNSGVRHFDTAFGALGGCPFIKGASGNIGSEDTLFMLGEMGYQTGVDRSKVAECSFLLEEFLGKPLPGKMYRAELDTIAAN